MRTRKYCMLRYNDKSKCDCSPICARDLSRISELKFLYWEYIPMKTRVLTYISPVFPAHAHTRRHISAILLNATINPISPHLKCTQGMNEYNTPFLFLKEIMENWGVYCSVVTIVTRQCVLCDGCASVIMDTELMWLT